VLPDEAVAIKDQAKRCGLSTATYLRNLGLGFPTRDLSAPKTVLELCQLHGDLVRIGSLLEMWLLNDARLAVQERAMLSRNIQALLAELHVLQSALLETVQRL
jgi:hypothetical protein